MARRSKAGTDFEAAVRGVEDGSTIAFGGCARSGPPFSLAAPPPRQGTKRWTRCVRLPLHR